MAFLCCQGGTKKHKVGKEQAAANTISGEDVLVGAQQVVPEQTSSQSHGDRWPSGHGPASLHAKYAKYKMWTTLT